MKTAIISINPKKPGKKALGLAVATIRKGGLVAFPTETVYGLGADALNGKAVRKIFQAKGRASDNPLIVHISSEKGLPRLVSRIPESARKLMKKFWPGPLTIIFPRSDIVPDAVTAGLDTVAIRMPSGKIARELVRIARTPIAAPSANISGRPSPTKGRHVIEDLDGKVDVIIDGGPCEIGLESTVIDITGKFPLVLRPGRVSLAKIREVLPSARAYSGGSERKPRSPGMKYRHYSPKAKVVLVTGSPSERRRKMELFVRKGRGPIAVIASFGVKEADHFFKFGNLSDLAASLFSKYREFDSLGARTIIVEGCARRGLGVALMNRIEKSAGKVY